MVWGNVVDSEASWIQLSGTATYGRPIGPDRHVRDYVLGNGQGDDQFDR